MFFAQYSLQSLFELLGLLRNKKIRFRGFTLKILASNYRFFPIFHEVNDLGQQEVLVSMFTICVAF